MIKQLKVLIFSLLGVGGFFSSFALQEKKAKEIPVIAITQIVEHPALDATYKGLLDRLNQVGYVQGENFKLVFESAQGDIALATQIAQKFRGMNPSVIVAIGTPSAQTLKSVTQNTNIPLVFSSITDPLKARLVESIQNTSGNTTGLSNWIALELQLNKFKSILPSLKKLGIVYNPGETNSVTLVHKLKKIAPKLGLEMVESVAITAAEVGMAAQKLVGKVEAIFITNDNTALSAFDTIAQVARVGKVPLFVSDTDLVQKGAVAAFGPNQYELGRQTADIVLQILKGKKPSEIPVQFPRKIEFFLNKDALNAIGLAINPSLYLKADKVFSAINSN